MRIIRFAAVILITGVLIAGIAFPMVPQPHAWFQFPVIPGLEEKARNIFFHVPVAWASVFGFLLSLVFGVRYLRFRKLDDDLQSVAAAEVGLVFCVLATVTGSLWAKFNWGSFWNWDPRETSIAILLMIYGAYFALRSALDAEETRARLSAVYAVLAGMTAPFFVFILPRMFGGLHPGSKGDSAGSAPVAQLHMPENMHIVFFCGILGFTALFLWIWNLRVRVLRIEYSQQP
jgi:heme exporter protein C